MLPVASAPSCQSHCWRMWCWTYNGET